MAENTNKLIPDASPEDQAVIDELEGNSSENTNDPIYVQGLLFDSDLHLNGSGNIIICSADESWLNWCKKTLSTPRYQHEGYSRQIGVDVDAAFKAKTRAEAEEILKTEIKGALTADPYHRTANVESIIFDWIAPDAVEVLVTITGFYNIRTEIEATLGNYIGE